jgi:hypothetical protein
MTQEHPITPPPELIVKWAGSMCGYYEAARWGADQQLEQDAKWLDTNALFSHNLTISPSGDALRQEMRPKPPSLKEQALQALATVLTADQHALIRKALEQLDD